MKTANQQFHMDMHTGHHNIVKPSKSGRSETVDGLGQSPRKFHNGVTGKSDFQQRLMASYLAQDVTISGHAYANVLREKIPRKIQKSITNIDKYLPPNKSPTSLLQKMSQIQNDRTKVSSITAPVSNRNTRKKFGFHSLQKVEELPSLDKQRRNNFGHFSSVTEDFEKSQSFLKNIKKHKKAAIGQLNKMCSSKQNSRDSMVLKSVRTKEKPKGLVSRATQHKVFFYQTGVLNQGANETVEELLRKSVGKLSICSLGQSMDQSSNRNILKKPQTQNADRKLHLDSTQSLDIQEQSGFIFAGMSLQEDTGNSQPEIPSKQGDSRNVYNLPLPLKMPETSRESSPSGPIKVVEGIGPKIKDRITNSIESQRTYTNFDRSMERASEYKIKRSLIETNSNYDDGASDFESLRKSHRNATRVPNYMIKSTPQNIVKLTKENYNLKTTESAISCYKSQTSFLQSRRCTQNKNASEVMQIDEPTQSDSSEQDEEDKVVLGKFPFVKIIDHRKPDETTMRVSTKTKQDFEDIQKLDLVDKTQEKHFNRYLQNKNARAKTKSKFAENPKVQALLGQNDFWSQQNTKKILDKLNPSVANHYNNQDKFYKENAMKRRKVLGLAERTLNEQMKSSQRQSYKKWVLPDL